MWSPSIQRIIITTVILLFLIKFFFWKNEQSKLDSEENQDSEKENYWDSIQKLNSFSINEGDEKRYELYSNLPANPNLAKIPKKLAAIDASKTAICETDTFIGQQVLCSFEEKRDEETSCDSDSLQHYSDFDDFERENELDSNFTNWTILFARRDPIERFIDHFMDYCVRESRACFQCRLDLRCFLNNIYTEIEKIRAGNVTVNEDELKYVPQHWFCQMETKNQRFEFIDYTLFANPTNPEYAEAKRPNADEIFAENVSFYEKIQKFYTVFLHSRPDVLDLFVKTYYWDYLMLKMPLPELKVAKVRDYKKGWK
ncbi:Protein CBG16438 [Caenorhabditis briggsae]|uniref:Protein CBG16438 n=1 Tax=Caenorhabditis briggsae TaxID=6238 RepID=A8XP31_CAEBR|nr:Protein CBG16438 [Caenorhabditis briggsae]CAP34407.2 Protein CBG16438 [Caenorhabditis briggsae]